MRPLLLAAALLLACDHPGAPTPAATPEHSVRNFSWVEADSLAGMAKPGAYAELSDDLASVQAQGVQLVVTLTEDALPDEALAEAGLEAVHIPVIDYTAPTQEQLLAYVQLVREAAEDGRPVATHCYAGKGRTGTMLGAWLVSTGMSGIDAIDAIRQARPGSIETEEQEQAVIAFEATWAALFP